MKNRFFLHVLSMFLAVVFLSPLSVYAEDESAEEDVIIQDVQYEADVLSGKEGDRLEMKFLKAVAKTIEYGYVYAASVNYLENKKMLLDNCILKYTGASEDKSESYDRGHYVNFSRNFLKKDFSEDEIKKYDACLTGTDHPRIGSDDISLSGFKNYWSKYEILGDFIGFTLWMVRGKSTVILVPHPLLIMNKLASELGELILVAEGDYRDSYKLYVSQGIGAMLDRAKYGAQGYVDEMKDISLKLKEILAEGSRNKKKDEDSALVEQDNKGPEGGPVAIPAVEAVTSKDLIRFSNELYRAILEVGDAIILTPKERRRYGLSVAKIAHPLYKKALEEKEKKKEGVDEQIVTDEDILMMAYEVDDEYDRFKNSELENKKNKRKMMITFTAVVKKVFPKLISEYLEKNQKSSERGVLQKEFKRKDPLKKVVDDLG